MKVGSLGSLGSPLLTGLTGVADCITRE